jgi:hypothetical protein
MIYSTTSSSQSQETTMTKKQADIHNYLKIARDVANKQELNKKQYLFLFNYASYLDSI